MASGRPKTLARLALLVIVLLIAGGVFVYMQNRPASPDDIAAAIGRGELWGEPKEAADELFGVTATRIENTDRDPPSTERWLYEVPGRPGTFYLIRIQNGTISQAQRARPDGQALRAEETSSD